MSNAPAKPKPKHDSRRTAILLAILGLGIVMLAYDFYVARPACDAGMVKVQKLIEKSMTSRANENKVTPAIVQKELGFAPSATEKVHERYTLETYKWRGGLPFRSYDVYVVYQGLENPVLHNATQNQYPEDDVMPAKTIRAQPSTNKGAPISTSNTPADPTATNPAEPAKNVNEDTGTAKNNTEPKAADAGERRNDSKDKPAGDAKPTDEAKSP